VAYNYWGLATLRWLATASDTELPLEEAAGLVRNWATWSATCKGHHGTTDRAIFDVLEHRPALLAAAATLPPGSLWAQAAANSRHLTDPAAEQLLAVACSVSIDNTYRALQPVIEVLTGLIANPAVTTAVADLATAQANLLVTRVPTFATKLRRATNIRKRVSRLTAKVGGRSLTAPKPESVRDGALCVNWSTTADLSVLKLLVGLRGNLLDVYNSAALAANPHLGEQAYRIAKRLQDWHYVTSKSPTVVTSREAFKANYPELSAQIELSARRYWQPSHRDNQATVGVAPLYVEEYVRPGGGYAFPLIKINSWQWKERAEALTAVAEHLANRLGDNQAAWSLVFALADQFTKDDIDMLVDACLKLTPA
jgi:hypothetical protein